MSSNRNGEPNDAGVRGQVAIVAAMEREVTALVRGWKVILASDAGKEYKIFKRDGASLVCAGIGAKAARRAAEFLAERSDARILMSVGYAGAAVATLHVGQTYVPATVADAGSGRTFATLFGSGVLASVGLVADTAAKLAAYDKFKADAVDMEAAAVAEVAERRGLGFAAVKAVSEPHDAVLPPIHRFISEEGEFQAVRFALWLATKPRWWGAVRELMRGSRKASAALSELLERLLEEQDWRRANAILEDAGTPAQQGSR